MLVSVTGSGLQICGSLVNLINISLINTTSIIECGHGEVTHAAADRDVCMFRGGSLFIGGGNFGETFLKYFCIYLQFTWGKIIERK